MPVMRTPARIPSSACAKSDFLGIFFRSRILLAILLACILQPRLSFAADTVAAEASSASTPPSTVSQAQHIPQEIKRLTVAKYINAVAWTADGSRLAAVSGFGGDITVWDTKTWAVVKEFHNYGSMYAFNSLSFLPDGSLLTTPTIGPSPDPKYETLKHFALVQWNPNTATPIRYLPNVPDPTKDLPIKVGPTDTYAVSRDGTWIAGTGGKGVLLFDSKKGSLSRVIDIPDAYGHPDLARSIAFSPDGKELGVCTAFGMAHIFKLQDGSARLSFKAYPNERFSCGAMAYSPDGKYIATGRHHSFNFTDINEVAVDIWHVNDGSRVTSLPGSTNGTVLKGEVAPVRTLSWSANDNVFAVGDDLSLRLWRVTETSQTLLFDKSISHGAFNVSFSPQGVLAATDNNQVVIYQ